LCRLLKHLVTTDLLPAHTGDQIHNIQGGLVWRTWQISDKKSRDDFYEGYNANTKDQK
jgi:hypothetical protein